ncbi:MAG: heavy-metal-associated domain-containing protein [Clostridia bacterium]|nr:heavy-metal-associated domain-containing protein [Clostridia bacterium]
MNPLAYVLILALAAILCLLAVVNFTKKEKSTPCTCEACSKETESKEWAVKTLVYIDGMSCEHCSARVEAAFSEKGYDAVVDLSEKCATVLSDEPLNQEEIFAMIEGLGFSPVRMEM